jgi:hypothetical protein
VLRIDEYGSLFEFMMYWGNCTQMVRYAVLPLCCHYECQQVITRRSRDKEAERVLEVV